MIRLQISGETDRCAAAEDDHGDLGQLTLGPMLCRKLEQSGFVGMERTVFLTQQWIPHFNRIYR